MCIRDRCFPLSTGSNLKGFWNALALPVNEARNLCFSSKLLYADCEANRPGIFACQYHQTLLLQSQRLYPTYTPAPSLNRTGDIPARYPEDGLNELPARPAPSCNAQL